MTATACDCCGFELVTPNPNSLNQQRHDLCIGARTRRYSSALEILIAGPEGGAVAARGGIVYTTLPDAPTDASKIAGFDQADNLARVFLAVPTVERRPVAVDSVGRVYYHRASLAGAGIMDLYRLLADGTIDGSYFSVEGVTSGQTHARTYGRVRVRSDDSLIVEGAASGDRGQLSTINADGTHALDYTPPEALATTDLDLDADGCFAVWTTDPESPPRTLYLSRHTSDLARAWLVEIGTDDDALPSTFNADRGFVATDPNGGAYVTLADTVKHYSTGGSLDWSLTLPGLPVTITATEAGAFITWQNDPDGDFSQLQSLGLVNSGGSLVAQRSIPDITAGKFAAHAGDDSTVWISSTTATPYVLGRTPDGKTE